MSSEDSSTSAEAGGRGFVASGVKIPTFWPHAPKMWFIQAECVFHSKNLVSSFDKYCHLVSALPHESLRLIMDLAENPPADNPYEAVKDRLLQSHQLTEYQRVEKIMAMPALGARKPSQMMATMLELCPPGQEASPFFHCCFMQRLPRGLRVAPSEAVMKRGALGLCFAPIIGRACSVPLRLG